MSSNDCLITLASGRKLGYAEYGDPAGFPVIYFHGGLSCRTDAMTGGPAALSGGIRLIAPDRPGIATSDRNKGFALLDWPKDVAELADQLGLARFAVMGWSFGGAYTMACGYALGERVTDTVLIASGIPFNWPGMMDEINSGDRMFLKMSGGLSAVDLAAFEAVGLAARTAPKAFVKETVKEMVAQDRAAIEADPDAFVATTIEAMSKPGGVLDDYRIWKAPWGFDPSDLKGPVQQWYGTEDGLCHPSWPGRLADAIPQMVSHPVDGAGHFVARVSWQDVFAEVRR